MDPTLPPHPMDFLYDPTTNCPTPPSRHRPNPLSELPKALARLPQKIQVSAEYHQAALEIQILAHMETHPEERQEETYPLSNVMKKAIQQVKGGTNPERGLKALRELHSWTLIRAILTERPSWSRYLSIVIRSLRDPNQRDERKWAETLIEQCGIESFDYIHPNIQEDVDFAIWVLEYLKKNNTAPSVRNDFMARLDRSVTNNEQFKQILNGL